MLSRRQTSRRAQFLATTLTTLAGLSLACGDDVNSDRDDSAETEEHSAEHEAHEQQVDSSKKQSSGKAGEAAEKVDAGSASSDDENKDQPKQPEQPEQPNDEKKASEPAKPAADKPAKQDKPPAEKGPDDKQPPAEPVNLKVSLRFHAKVGKADFACSHKYSAQGIANTTVTPLDFRLFVHAVELIKDDGAKVPLKLIARDPWQSETLALLDFEDKTGRCSDGTAETNTAITGTAPAGAYKGISFVVGVPDELNYKDPASAAEPLKSAVSSIAAGTPGFRFAQVGLTQLTSAGDATGSGLFDLGATQCTGSVADGNVKCEKANRNLIRFESFDLEKNSVAIDVAKLFAQVDLTQTQTCHSVEKSCVPMFSAFGVDFTTGKANDAQLVFSAE